MGLGQLFSLRSRSTSRTIEKEKTDSLCDVKNTVVTASRGCDSTNDLLLDYDIIDESEVENIADIQYVYTPSHDVEAEMYETEMDINLNWMNCKKHPGHKNFIPISEFDLNNLPYMIRTQEICDWVRAMANRTVKISVHGTSERRKGSDPYFAYIKSGMSRTCTGLCLCKGRWDMPYRHSWDRSMMSSEGSESGPKVCNLPNCPFLEEHGSHAVDFHLTFSVRTSQHCVFDDFEAACTEVHFFYDSEDDHSECVTAYGVQVLSVDPQADTAVLLCVAKPCEKLYQLCDQLTQFHIYTQEGGGPASAPRWAASMKYAIMASHPHGTSKKISVGKFRNKNITLLPNTQNLKAEIKSVYSTPTCFGCSGAAVMIEQGHFPTSFLYVIHRGSYNHKYSSYSVSDVYSPCVF